MEFRVASKFKHNGYGSSVISRLIKAGLKKNLYYEIKDVTVEERQDGVHAYKQKIRTKVYGLNSTRDVRKQLIDILIDRVENHKDKIISPIIYNELLGMEIKRNGKVEHSDSTHDDQVFSMLMALWVWYEGINLGERYGIKKSSIRTDDDIDEPVDWFNDDTVDIVDSFNTKEELDLNIEADINAAIKAGGVQMNDFIEKQRMKERQQYEALINTPLGERAYRTKFNIPKDQPLNKYINTNGQFDLPDSIFTGFYNPTDKSFENFDGEQFKPTAVAASQAAMLEDEDYHYIDHFNF